MSKKSLITVVLLIILFGFGFFIYSVNKTHNNQIIGTIQGQNIYEKDLDEQERQNLFEARNQLYKSAENILTKRFFQKTIDEYKKQHKIDDDLSAQQAYISENIQISDTQIQEFIKKNEDNALLKGKTFEEQKQIVEPYLKQEAVQIYFENFVKNASDKGLLKVLLLEKPNTPTVSVKISPEDPSVGPSNAPITIVEFADFQCPYCNSVLPTIQSILKKYEGKIHFVFKNYPLVQIHPEAVNAAIAAKCAQEQDKYWNMHDKIFENHDNLSDTLYINLATQLKLDLNKFKECQQNKDIYNQVMNDMEYGQSLGITATPAFYINGKLIMGAQPFSVFQQTIEEELKKNK